MRLHADLAILAAVLLAWNTTGEAACSETSESVEIRIQGETIEQLAAAEFQDASILQVAENEGIPTQVIQAIIDPSLSTEHLVEQQIRLFQNPTRFGALHVSCMIALCEARALPLELPNAAGPWQPLIKVARLRGLNAPDRVVAAEISTWLASGEYRVFNKGDELVTLWCEVLMAYSACIPLEVQSDFWKFVFNGFENEAIFTGVILQDRGFRKAMIARFVEHFGASGLPVIEAVLRRYPATVLETVVNSSTRRDHWFLLPTLCEAVIQLSPDKVTAKSTFQSIVSEWSGKEIPLDPDYVETIAAAEVGNVDAKRRVARTDITVSLADASLRFEEQRTLAIEFLRSYIEE